MEANVIATDGDLVRVGSQRGQYVNSRKIADNLDNLTERFQNALKKSVEGIVEAGRVLIQAKGELEHGQFTDWVVNELRFGTQKAGSPHADIRKAEMLMFLARNEVISKSCHWHAFEWHFCQTAVSSLLPGDFSRPPTASCQAVRTASGL